MKNTKLKPGTVTIATPAYLAARKPMYENNMCKAVRLIATCNNCERIIFADEKAKKEYIRSGGYCPECIKENNY